MASSSARRAQLQALVDGLSALIDVLSYDPSVERSWQRHFTDCQTRATALAAGPDPLPQPQLNDLSASVMRVFGGMGSFNDYAPVSRAPGGGYAVIPGMEGLSDASGRVHEAALALRVVGSV